MVYRNVDKNIVCLHKLPGEKAPYLRVFLCIHAFICQGIAGSLDVGLNLSLLLTLLQYHTGSQRGCHVGKLISIVGLAE